MCLLLLACLPLAASLDEGLAAYKRGDFATALESFRTAAEAGDETAMFSLGFMYLRGEGVPVDPTEAAHWLRLAAERGVAPAQHSLALLYYEGRGVARNTAVAANYFESAALRGLADAQYNLGVLYSRGDGVSQDWALAQFWHRKAADQGVTESQLALGVMLANGLGVPRDYEEAARWYAKAANAGNARARNMLEESFLDLAIRSASHADRSHRDFSEVASPLPDIPSSAPKEASVPTASQAVHVEKPVAALSPRAAKLTPARFQELQAQAVEGDASAQAHLARQYLDGISVPVNLVRAYVWAVRSQQNGFAEAAKLVVEADSRMNSRQRAAARSVLGQPTVRE